jgi:hypothetical protein
MLTRQALGFGDSELDLVPGGAGRHCAFMTLVLSGACATAVSGCISVSKWSTSEPTMLSAAAIRP